MRITTMILSVLSLMPPMAAWGRTFTSGNLAYEVVSETDRTCRVTGMSSGGVTSVGQLVIPYSVTDGASDSYVVTEVGESAFEGMTMSSMVISPGAKSLYFAPNAMKSVKLLGLEVSRDFTSPVNHEPFYAMSSLQSLTIGSGMTRVPAFAFAKTNITTVSIPTTVESVGYGAFLGAGKLTWVSFSSGGKLQSVGGEAFNDCLTLSNVGTLPEGVTTIGVAAFANTSINYISLPSTLTSIGANVFVGCKNLRSVYLSPSNKNYYYADGLLFSADRKVVCQMLLPMTSVTIPEGVTTIGNSAFWQAELTSVVLPSTLTSIGDDAFHFCRKLSAIILPDGLKSIGENAFAYCNALASINLPEGLNEIRAGGFLCSGLKSVTLPSTLHTISDEAFSRTELESIEIPETVNYVGESTFEACFSLKSVSFGTSWNTVKVLPPSLFKDCHVLTEITFPAFLEEIGEQAFSGCWELSEISLPGTTRTIGAEAFADGKNIASVSVSASTPPSIPMNGFDIDVYRAAALRVPKGCADAYKKAETWQLFSTIDESSELSGVAEVTGDTADDSVTVYGLGGVKIYEGAKADMPELPSGIYVVGGRKMKF